ncbi:diguanylate cyclase domain-containing protein [Marinilactibacillus psychrotolerans]
MTIKKANRLWLFVLISLVLFYFVWLFIWKEQTFIRTTGGNILSVIGVSLPTFWLFKAFLRSNLKVERIYWLFLFLSTVSYLLAELCWFYIETILSESVGFTGIYDLLYIFSVLFYFAAFMYKILAFENKSLLLKLFFDISIIMTVSITFSWHYILVPFVEQGNVSLLSLSFTLFYPISDLLLLFCASVFYLNGENYFPKHFLYYILIGLCIQIFADSIYLFKSIHETYFSGSWIDPLFLIPIMLIGYTALVERESVIKEPLKDTTDDKSPYSLLRLVLPYVLVAFLFIFMIRNSEGMDAISIGSGITILLVILRQFVVIVENQYLIKQYHQKKEELEISEERYRSLFEYHPDSVFSIDLKGKIESTNPAGASLLNNDPDALIGSSITTFIDEQYLEETKNNLSKVNQGWGSNHVFTIRDKNKKNLWIHITHIPILVKNKLVGSFGIGRDITEKKLNEEKIHFYAYHDFLTGLGNRRFFEEKLTQLLSQARSENITFAILFIDLDNFKEINDLYGHEIGDNLLSTLADRINHFAEDKDLTARMGGDEFTIVLKDIAEHNVQEEITDLSKLINVPYLIRNLEITCTSSIGFAYYPADGTTLTALLSKADNAMYRVKKNRKTAK